MYLSTFLAVGLSLVTQVTAGNRAAQRFVQIANNQVSDTTSYLKDISEAQSAPDTSSYRYLNPKTKPFLVNSLPDFNFDIGEFYSGEIPIDSANRTLFFAFKPSTGGRVEELTTWLNGGPGCSSLAGLIDENGPWTWQPGTFLPVENPYAWSSLTNMLWVEQPVGTGFSQGQVRAKSEEDVAADFVLFFKHFQQTFGISDYKVFITGESYAGRYVPYIAQAMIQQKDPKYFNVSGAMIYDPVIGSDINQFEASIAPFALENENFLNLNSSTLATISSLDKKCGYADWRSKYFKFPPPSSQPSTYKYPAGTNEDVCDLFDYVYNAASQVNPCFNIYSINTQCPLLWDVTGFPGGHDYLPAGASIYFNRADVKKAMHAPANVQWSVCANQDVLLDDTSADSTYKAIPTVIKSTNRFLIANGDYDMILNTNGTLLAIQNMTWGGKTGFQSQPNTPIVIQQADLAWGQPGPQGVMGIQHYERGLMWAETFQAGHMGPAAQPRVALRLLQWVLGRINTL